MTNAYAFRSEAGTVYRYDALGNLHEDAMASLECRRLRAGMRPRNVFRKIAASVAFTFALAFITSLAGHASSPSALRTVASTVATQCAQVNDAAGFAVCSKP